MKKIKLSNGFKRDLRLVVKRGYDISLLDEVVEKLARGESLEDKYDNHKLFGKYSGYWECHIKSDWLLVYKFINNELVLELFRTGTHSDLI